MVNQTTLQLANCQTTQETQQKPTQQHSKKRPVQRQVQTPRSPRSPVPRVLANSSRTKTVFTIFHIQTAQGARRQFVVCFPRNSLHQCFTALSKGQIEKKLQSNPFGQKRHLTICFAKPSANYNRKRRRNKMSAFVYSVLRSNTFPLNRIRHKARYNMLQKLQVTSINQIG